MITLLYTYYNQEEQFQKMLPLWEELRNQFNVLIIDDCSEKPLIAPSNIKVYRVTEDIAWNQPGCRNLGFMMAPNEWVLALDMDHTLSLKHLYRMHMAQVMWNICTEWNQYYLFHRFKDGKKIQPHPNIFLMHKKMYWEIGGYDESFCGNYGYDDVIFDVLRNSYEHCYLPWPVHYDRAGNTKGLTRTGTVNKKLLDKRLKEIAEDTYCPELFKFKWDKNLH